MNPVMYLVANPRVPLSKGKFGAQAGHATMIGLELSPDDWLQHVWRHRGGQYAKVVLMADDLMVARDYIQDRGFKCGLVIDEGRTELGNTLTPTFLGVQIVDKDDGNVKATFGQFKLYREPKPPPEKTSFIHQFKERHRGNSPRRDSRSA